MRYFKIKLLFGLLTIALFGGCDSEDPLPEGSVPEINGGHQAIVENKDLVIYYGLFNGEGEASTSFKKGEEIYFSFWVENTSDVDVSFPRPFHSKFMYVFLKKGIDNFEFVGSPLGGFCQQDGRPVSIEKNSIVKAPLLQWFGTGEFWFFCEQIEGEILEAGDYFTTIQNPFRFCYTHDDCSDEITLRIDFEITE